MEAERRTQSLTKEACGQLLAEEWRGLSLMALPREKRRSRLFWVGLLGLVAYAIYFLGFIIYQFVILPVLNGDNCGKFYTCIDVFDCIAYACIVGCYIVLMVSDAKWRRSLMCWLGVIGTGLYAAYRIAWMLGRSLECQGQDFWCILWGLRPYSTFCLILSVLPVLKLRCLVSRVARLIGAMGVWILVVVNLFWAFRNFWFRHSMFTDQVLDDSWWHLFLDKWYKYLGHYAGTFGFWFPIVASAALFVFFLVVFISREKSFEPVTGAWHAGRSKRNEYWGKIAVLTLVGEGGALLLFFGTRHSSPAAFSSFVFRHPLVHLLVVGLWLLPFGIASIPVTVRRLHDVNLSGWWVLCGGLLILLFTWVPFVGWLVQGVQIGILGCLNGAPGPNKYGPDPKGQAPLPPIEPARKQEVRAMAPEERLRELRELKALAESYWNAPYRGM